jgi:hypothetical protein
MARRAYLACAWLCVCAARNEKLRNNGLGWQVLQQENLECLHCPSRKNIHRQSRRSVPDFSFQLCRGRDAGCPAPPSQIPAGGIPAPGSSRWHVVFAHRKVCPFDPSFLRHGLPVWASPTRRPLLQFRGCALPLDTTSRSDSRSARRRFLSLRRPSCLALAVSAAGTLRASSVPCVCFGARHALRPRQAVLALTFSGRFHVGFRYADTVPACVCCFRGCIA